MEMNPKKFINLICQAAKNKQTIKPSLYQMKNSRHFNSHSVVFGYPKAGLQYTVSSPHYLQLHKMNTYNCTSENREN